MAKTKLLNILALSTVVALMGCAKSEVQDENGGAISTEPLTEEVAAPTEVTEVVEATETVVADVEEAADTMMAAMPKVNVVYFDFDQSTIRAEYRTILDLHAAYLSENTNAQVILEGHADERGTREYNLALGERRADSVASYLKLRGVSASQFELVSFGEEKPVMMGSTSEAYSKNRRVEFKYQ